MSRSAFAINLNVYEDLVAAGLIGWSDVEERKHDTVDDTENERRKAIRSGHGDDAILATSESDTLFFCHADGTNDEGQHVNVVHDFELGSEGNAVDSLFLKFGDGFFRKDEVDANGIETGHYSQECIAQANPKADKARFDSARDFADLLFFLNTTDGRRLDVAGEDHDNDSYVKVVDATDDSGNVVGQHLVMKFDQTDKRGEDHVTKHGLQTDDVTIVMALDFTRQLAAQFARDLGFANESASRQDTVHIAEEGSSAKLSGGSGDNLFIMSETADVISLDDRRSGNDERSHVNIVHGFDLQEDGFHGRFDGGFFDGSNQRRFEGATGLLDLMSFAAEGTIAGNDGNLSFALDPVSPRRDPLTVVLTETTLEDVHSAAVDQIHTALMRSGVVDSGSVVETNANRPKDDVIVDRNWQGRLMNSSGDDLLIGTGEPDEFFFDERDVANDEGDAVDVVFGFDEDDALCFRTDGFFGGSNKARFAHDEIDDLAAFLNIKGDDNGADYEADINSTVLTLDFDHHTNPDANQIIVLWDSGNLLA